MVRVGLHRLNDLSHLRIRHLLIRPLPPYFFTLVRRPLLEHFVQFVADQSGLVILQRLPKLDKDAEHQNVHYEPDGNAYYVQASLSNLESHLLITSGLSEATHRNLCYIQSEENYANHTSSDEKTLVHSAEQACREQSA